ncbi:hypothetical protein HK098_007366 [Nowakowskiella sp. JEL0407]|nr:hypothetical protein HK098_007366 [Nowakowskiella sp. JEL0407]
MRIKINFSPHLQQYHLARQNHLLSSSRAHSSSLNSVSKIRFRNHPNIAIDNYDPEVSDLLKAIRKKGAFLYFEQLPARTYKKLTIDQYNSLLDVIAIGTAFNDPNAKANTFDKRHFSKPEIKNINKLKFHASERVFTAISVAGLKPNAQTYLFLIHRCALTGNRQGMEFYLNHAKENNVTLNIESVLRKELEVNVMTKDFEKADNLLSQLRADSNDKNDTPFVLYMMHLLSIDRGGSRISEIFNELKNAVDSSNSKLTVSADSDARMLMDLCEKKDFATARTMLEKYESSPDLYIPALQSVALRILIETDAYDRAWSRCDMFLQSPSISMTALIVGMEIATKFAVPFARVIALYNRAVKDKKGLKSEVLRNVGPALMKSLNADSAENLVDTLAEYDPNPTQTHNYELFVAALRSFAIRGDYRAVSEFLDMVLIHKIALSDKMQSEIALSPFSNQEVRKLMFKRKELKSNSDNPDGDTDTNLKIKNEIGDYPLEIFQKLFPSLSQSMRKGITEKLTYNLSLIGCVNQVKLLVQIAKENQIPMNVIPMEKGLNSDHLEIISKINKLILQ